MSPLDKKCVMVIDAALPLGVLANTAAMLGITIGQRLPQIVGADVTDASGQVHTGISMLPISMLRGSEELLGELRLGRFATARDARVVVLAADAKPDAASRLQALGATCVLNKPVRISDLLNMLVAAQAC